MQLLAGSLHVYNRVIYAFSRRLVLTSTNTTPAPISAIPAEANTMRQVWWLSIPFINPITPWVSSTIKINSEGSSFWRVVFSITKVKGNYLFFKNSVFSTMLMPSILQSTSPSSSVRRIFFTSVPCLRVTPPPFTFRLLMRVTLSPSLRVLPLLSFTIDSAMGQSYKTKKPSQHSREGFQIYSRYNYLVTYITSFTALTTRSGFGRYSWIRVGAYGNGTSPPVMRNTGASR